MVARFLSLGVIGLISASCASLDTVNKTPDKGIAASLLVDDLQCRDTAEKKCAPGEQPKAVKFSAFDCQALPLRPETRESAHARCVFSGEIVRVDGTAIPLGQRERQFSLIELTPGVRVPQRAWTLAPLPAAPKS